MSDAENEDLLNELKVFASSFAGLEPAERGAAFSEMFTLERIEALVTEWERDEFQFDALMDVIASVRGIGVAVMISWCGCSSRRRPFSLSCSRC